MFCRLRPAPDAVVTALPDGISVKANAPDGKESAFTFDRVFGGQARQTDVFQEVSELVQSALDGYQVDMFCWPTWLHAADHKCIIGSLRLTIVGQDEPGVRCESRAHGCPPHKPGSNLMLS